jgi:hypothetical protein
MNLETPGAASPGRFALGIRGVGGSCFRPAVALLTGALLACLPCGPVSAAAPDSAGVAADSALARVPERDIMDVFAQLMGRRRVEPELELASKRRQGLSFTLLPSIGYNPSQGVFLGVSASAGGWLGDPETTTLSSGSAGVSYSTNQQLMVQVRSDFYSPDNKWALKGDWRYLDTNQPTYGLGPATSAQRRSPMDFKLYRLYQSLYWHVPKTLFYFGLGYHFDLWDEIEETDFPPGELTDYRVYSGGVVTQSQVSGISVNVLYDTRDNPINARRGSFWNASLRTFTPVFGSDQQWQALYSDFRTYPALPVGSRNALALWNYSWFTFGHPPYLSLPAIGWDTYGRSGRGWLQGRIRGENQIYTEAEYRAVLAADGLVGAVVFVNMTATTVPGPGYFGLLDPGMGAGLRIKFNKRNDTNLSVDLAWDEFRVSHVFFGLQEVF